LDLIPEDAVAVAVRDLKDLTRKGDKLAADTSVNFLPRPSQLFAEVVRGLGITKGLDETGPAFVMLANPAKAGVKLGPNGEPQLGDLRQLVVAAFSFTDRDQIAANFGIKKGELKPDSIVRGKAPAGNPWNIGLFFCAHGKQLFLGDNEKAVASAVKGRSAAAALGEARRRALRDADVLVHLPTKPWHGVWENWIVQAFERNLRDRGDAGDQRTARQLIGALRSVRAVLIAVRVDGGLGIRFVNIFPMDVNKSTRDFLASLNGGAGGVSSASVRQDAGLTSADQDRLAEKYAVRSIALLQQAKAAGFFQTSSGLAQLKNDRELRGLRSRPDFRKLLTELAKEKPAQPGKDNGTPK
jgi:hypothetical protein